MSNAELAAWAWSAVRRSADAPWANLSVMMKGKLMALAGKYAGGAKVGEGDYPPEGFAEKVAELASRQEFFVMGEGDGSGPELVSSRPSLYNQSPPDVEAVIDNMVPYRASPVEHEDVHIPSPIPEDVDPLKGDLREPALERRVSNRRGLMDKPGNVENDRRMGPTDRREFPLASVSTETPIK